MKTRPILAAAILTLLTLLSPGCISRPLSYSKTEWAKMSQMERKRAWDHLNASCMGLHASFEAQVLNLSRPDPTSQYHY